PLEYVNFTLKNGVAVIVLQETQRQLENQSACLKSLKLQESDSLTRANGAVETKPLNIKSFPAPLSEKPPDPPPHPIVAQFPPPTSPQVRPQSLVSDPPPVPPPPEPPDLNT
ncbi:hypothetical protein A2U01_0065254, partial [Trifolium medium]|nr:hypothetical protein [Trifolium medium]